MQVTGGRINNVGVWNSLATTPLYIILNVAVGGDWPGAPNANTLGSWGSEMEVAYVAHYESTAAKKFGSFPQTNMTTTLHR
ncbi:hypothetical protein NPX13_g8206 [Xylaria arbuscula]|uniref:GH16 domain-containing protein n=1 Tax=Xylaria arbuscula TaxID=114810 RepID=A0A9W8TKD8_9PEZI|nr:hypothetical protein NPX13_g8206 [Xylaria arbuscula]